ncbi:MAG: ABC transporter ATP-binding protein [Bacteroidota bacterium]
MIHISTLSYQYARTSSPALRDISLSVHAGEIFGLLGPSGAGKSTTQKVLTRLLRGYTGSIEILGKPLEDWSHTYFEQIGLGFELPNHYPKLSALENLKLFASFYKTRTKDPRQLLELVGLESVANQRVETFSKGMKMRLNFVRALLHDPQILFLDEPTSGLDPANARLIKQQILNLKAQGKTIVLTTHRMQDAEELCDRVAFMVDGRLAAMATPQSLVLEHGKRSVELRFGPDGSDICEFPLEGLGSNPDFLRMIKNRHIHSIHSQEASLEDIFIQVTGTTLS